MTVQTFNVIETSRHAVKENKHSEVSSTMLFQSRGSRCPLMRHAYALEGCDSSKRLLDGESLLPLVFTTACMQPRQQKGKTGNRRARSSHWINANLWCS